MKFLFQYVSATIIDVKENYSVTVENNLIGSNSNEKINVSILCPITRIGLIKLLRIIILLFLLAPMARVNVKRDNRILGGIIAGLILSIISLTALAFFIAYRK